jgi:hypothetical protein
MLISTSLITWAPVIVSFVVVSFHSVSRALAWAIHVASRPAVSSVTLINHATVHRPDRQSGKEYRRNELLHIESFAKMRTDPPASLCAAIFQLATRPLCALTHLERKILAVASRLLEGRRQCPVPQMETREQQQGVVARERSIAPDETVKGEWGPACTST